MPHKKASPTQSPVTIKKYANRRLYNTATSSYVTLDHLCHMVKEGTEFVVFDAKTGEDITRAVLTQIIVEEEGKGQNMLPVSFLRQIISFYGDSLQAVVPQYLDVSMSAFARNQEQMREYLDNVKDTFGGLFPFGPLEEMGKQNMAMFEQAMNLFTPFGADRGAEDSRDSAARQSDGDDRESEADEELASLAEKLTQLQNQFAALAKKKGR